MKFLGIDIGTGGSRAVLIDETGKVIMSKTSPHADFASPQIGWAEQDPLDWWRASTAAIRAILSNPDVRPDEIGAVGLSGQMHGSVLLDEADQVLRPALLWCDQRTQKQCDAITGKIGRERLIDLVCNPAITGFTLPKLLWVRENEPEIWARVRSVLLPKDYVRLCLSGDKASDVADASGTLLFDVKRRQWSVEMLDAFALDSNLLPTVYESIEITGRVSAGGAAATGLIEGTPIVAGAGDNAAGAIGMGIVKPGTLSATIGTSGVVFIVTERPTIDQKGRTHTLCHAIPDRWHMTGVTLGAGMSLKWFRDNFGGGMDFAALDEAAARVPAGADGAIWLPYLIGERTPHLDSQARAAFVGLTASHTLGHAVRAVMEGVAFSLLDAIEIFRDLGAPINEIRLGGGGSHSELWRQIQANVFAHPVDTAEADEGAAFGAAILAGVGAGAWASVDEACDAVVKPGSRTKPDPDAVSTLRSNYAAYKLLYPALQPAMNIINNLDQ